MPENISVEKETPKVELEKEAAVFDADQASEQLEQKPWEGETGDEQIAGDFSAGLSRVEQKIIGAQTDGKVLDTLEQEENLLALDFSQARFGTWEEEKNALLKELNENREFMGGKIEGVESKGVRDSMQPSIEKMDRLIEGLERGGSLISLEQRGVDFIKQAERKKKLSEAERKEEEDYFSQARKMLEEIAASSK